MQSKNNIKIKSSFSIIGHDLNNIELRSGVWNPKIYTLTDESKKGYLLPLVQALDGTRSPAEISVDLNISREEVESLLDHLQQLNVVETFPSTALDLYLSQASPAIYTANSARNLNLKIKKIIIVGDKELSSSLESMLKELNHFPVEKINDDDIKLAVLNNTNAEWLSNGLEFEEKLNIFSDWKDCLIVFLQKNINPHASMRLNKLLYTLKIAWFFAAIDGPFLFIGPTFSHDAACFDCFETRIKLNIKDHISYQKYKNAILLHQVQIAKSIPISLILKHLLVSHAAMEIINYSLTGCAFTKNKTLSIYLPTMEIIFNEFLRVAHCETCGTEHLRDASTLYFDINNLLDN